MSRELEETGSDGLVTKEEEEREVTPALQRESTWSIDTKVTTVEEREVTRVA